MTYDLTFLSVRRQFLLYLTSSAAKREFAGMGGAISQLEADRVYARAVEMGLKVGVMR